MRRTRRRRPKVAWLPTFGFAGLVEDPAAPAPGIEVELNFPAGTATDPTVGGVLWDAFPLTFDETEGVENAQADPSKVTLRDLVIGNEWRLRRLVGKAFINVAHENQTGVAHPAYDVALGFIVSKTHDDGSPQTDFNSVNPLSQESMEDPWIWRRRWILHPDGEVANDPASSTENSPQYWGFPRSNVSYGSVLDGPHIDAKSGRVIHRSERLYGVLAGKIYYAGGAISVAGGHIRMLLDYRLVGSLRGSSYGNRGNTSR